MTVFQTGVLKTAKKTGNEADLTFPNFKYAFDVEFVCINSLEISILTLRLLLHGV